MADLRYKIVYRILAPANFAVSFLFGLDWGPVLLFKISSQPSRKDLNKLSGRLAPVLVPGSHYCIIEWIIDSRVLTEHDLIHTYAHTHTHTRVSRSHGEDGERDLEKIATRSGRRFSQQLGPKARAAARRHALGSPQRIGLLRPRPNWLLFLFTIGQSGRRSAPFIDLRSIDVCNCQPFTACHAVLRFLFDVLKSRCIAITHQQTRK